MSGKIKDLTALVTKYQAKIASKPAKAASFEQKLDAKIAKIIAKGDTPQVNGVTVDATYNIPSSGGGSSGGGSSGGSSTTGSSYTLGTSAETLTGSALDDTFTAPILTLNAGDSLDGGAGNDTLNAEINADVGSTTKLAAIENVNVTAFGARSIDFTGLTGVTTLTSKDSTAALTLNNINSATMKLGFSGSVSNNITANYKAGALDGLSDVSSLVLNTAKAVSVDLDPGFESMSIAVTGTSDIDGVTAPGITTFNISGSGNLDIATGLLTGFETISASGYTGALTTGSADATTGYASGTLTGGSNGSTVILGTGADNVGITGGAAANKVVTVKLGGGDDRLLLTTGNTGSHAVFGEDGNDQVRVDDLDENDIIDLGTGTDTLNITANTTGTGAVLRGVENLVVESSATAVVLNSADKALTVTQKVNNTAADLSGLSAGSTVTFSKATSTATQGTNLAVAFKSTEATSTINITDGLSGTLTLDKITNATVNIGAASSLGGAITTTSTTTDLTLNITGALSNNKDIASTDGKLANITATGTDAIDFANITSSGVANVTFTAAKNIDIGTITASTKLANVTATSTTGTVGVGNLGGATVTNLSTVIATGSGDTKVGTVDALKIGTLSASSSKGAAEIGAISGAAAVATIGNITVSGATTATLGAVGNNTDDTLSDITVTATNGLLKVGTVLAKAAGTISYTSTNGAIEVGNTAVTATDDTGITVNMTGKTFISSTGTDTTATTVQNTGGNITATLSGAADAGVNYTTVTKGVVNLTSSLTGALTTTVTNAGTAGNADVSTLTLGNAGSGKTNSLTVKGIADTVNITGGSGNDTVAFDTANTIKNGTIALAGGAADHLNLANIRHANGSIGDTDGLAVNLGSTNYTFNEGQSYASTLVAGTVARYQTANATSAALPSTGLKFTVSGVDQITMTGGADYVIGSSTGMTINGGAGADTIIGGASNDTITGGDGNDSVTGGLGNDTFVFDQTGANKISLVNDFTGAGTTAGDLIDFAGGLSAFDSSDFIAAAASAATIADGKLRVVTDGSFADAAAIAAAFSLSAINADSNDSVIIVANDGSSVANVYYAADTNGDVVFETVVLIGKLTGVSAASLAQSDFV